MDRIVVNVEEQDRIYVENECEKTHTTFDQFFKMILDKYRSNINEKFDSNGRYDSKKEDANSKQKKTRKNIDEENPG